MALFSPEQRAWIAGQIAEQQAEHRERIEDLLDIECNWLKKLDCGCRAKWSWLWTADTIFPDDAVKILVRCCCSSHERNTLKKIVHIRLKEELDGLRVTTNNDLSSFLENFG